MFLLIDNYDSFTYNLRHYLGELGAEVEVCRNDAITLDDVQSMSVEGLVISPGPCDPDRAGICLELIEKVKDEMPILGVCLGHQCIGQVFGGKIVLAPKPMHGKVSDIFHQSDGLMNGIPSPFRATRYHSLAIEPGTLPSFLSVMATSEDGVIQGISHKELPIFGVQFHPESIASEHGHKLIQNFLDIVKARPGNRKVA